MTTTQKETTPTPTVPEVLTDEHHEAIKASWAMPAYDREAPTSPTPVSRKPLYVGLITGTLGLAIGMGAGYWIGSDATTEAAPPISVSTTVPMVPGYSITHDSQIVEPYSYSAVHDSRILGEPDSGPMGGYSRAHDSVTPAAFTVMPYATHGDSRIIEFPVVRPAPAHDDSFIVEPAGYSVTHDSTIIEPVVDTSSTHDSRIP